MKDLHKNFDSVIPPRCDVVMLHAHADDESFLSAGIIQELIARRHKVVLVYLASAIVHGEEKTIIRQNELADACRVIGINNIAFLNFCEPKHGDKGSPLHLQSVERVTDQLWDSLKKLEIKNPFIFSYDENGGYGNKDHVVVHRVGRHILNTNLQICGLVEVTISRDLYLCWMRNIKTSDGPKNFLPRLEYWSDNFGLDSTEINFCFTLTNDQIALKREALSRHVSQIKKDEFPLVLNDTDFNHLFGKEYFAHIS